ncbi:predicted protein [Naegleria gruberi]|uniref:Predicted protein n=1 Tax=Naegleria gruberi TaxID=5762 RepID=D2V1E2_NAEGR|nr:uncharacterized protein NAEGRDRAFT_62548 [Naegleria gruberi]EFC49150.1 predicted protein [Naegleria gruberi]|eukprot:XP_002681894.1 predicted protein [Naegleria gruberi strain NEG-M]
MPKKTKKEIKDERLKSALADEDSDSYDEQSDVSTSTMARHATMEQLATELSEGIENLTEKAAAKRLEGLTTICKIMKLRYIIEILGGQLESLINGAIQCCAKSTSAEETILAFNLFTLISTTIGGCSSANDQRNLFGSKSLNTSKSASVILTEDNSLRMKEVLTRHADAATKKKSEVRCEALFSLSVLEFMDCSPEDLILEKENNKLDVFKQYWNDQDEQVASTAIEGWSLLATMIPNKYKVSILVPSSLKLLSSIIASETKSSSEKIAAGQAVALLFDAINNMEDSSIAQVEYDNLVTAMNKVASISTKSVSKKERATQRMNFRNFVNTVEDGDCPVEEMNVSGNVLLFENWDRLVQLVNFKRVLEGGILEHFKFNSNLQLAFGVDGMDLSVEKQASKLDSMQKKFYLSKNSDFNKNDTLEKNKLTRQFSNYVQTEED